MQRSAESDISLKYNCFIMRNQQKHIIVTLVWVRTHCEIKNGKTTFTSWGKSMAEFKCYNYLDSETKDMNRETWF